MLHLDLNQPVLEEDDEDEYLDLGEEDHGGHHINPGDEQDHGEGINNPGFDLNHDPDVEHENEGLFLTTICID